MKLSEVRKLGNTLAFNISTMELEIDRKKKFAVKCPYCGSSNLETENWFEAKEYDRPLTFECKDCKEKGILEDDLECTEITI
ncbi:MAG: hypothetical protein QW478_11515 [Candidatus Micrarchaeaceae archaeon]